MAAALDISGLHAWYGESHILHDVNLSVQHGEVVTTVEGMGMFGRRPAGKAA